MLVLGEGGTAAMASRPDPDGPRQKGLDGATLSANNCSIKPFKGCRTNKGRYQNVFYKCIYIYIIPLWTQNFPGCPGNTFCFDVGCGRHVEFAFVRTSVLRYEPGQEPIMERAL